ncbi:hypothetical protein FRB91_000268 [Serendipita sp. 411]|nr:hypothetical protein FRB91_000268 [Serendipita sp. 411]
MSHQSPLGQSTPVTKNQNEENKKKKEQMCKRRKEMLKNGAQSAQKPQDSRRSARVCQGMGAYNGVATLSALPPQPVATSSSIQSNHVPAIRRMVDPNSFSIAQKLPLDILSLITLERTRSNWIAPLAISQVCRLWRTAALSTPVAWSYLQIDPYKPLRPQFVDLWLSRCGAVPCRLSFGPWGSFPLVQVACSRVGALEALSLFESTQVLIGSFPKLKELRLSGSSPEAPRKWKWSTERGSNIGFISRLFDRKRTSSLLSHSRFPALRILHLHSPSELIMQTIAQQDLPPLEELHVHATGSSWEMLISFCAPTLVRLGICYEGHNVQTAKPRTLHLVTLPILTSLSVVVDNSYNRMVDDLNFTTFKTPSLETYYEKQNERSDSLQSPIHSDTLKVKTVTFVGTSIVDWTRLPCITSMTVQATGRYCQTLCDSLKAQPRQPPHLSEIQWVIGYSLQEHTVRLLLQQRRQITGKTININLRVIKESEYVPPHESFEKCFTYLPGTCGSKEGNIFREQHEPVEESSGDELETWSDGGDSYDSNCYGNHFDDLTDRYSGCPAGIDSDGPYDELGQSWYD